MNLIGYFGMGILTPMCCIKFILTSLNFLIGAQCIYLGDTVEKCNGSMFGENRQEIYDTISAYSALFESISAFLCFIAVMVWKSFHIRNFFKSMFLVGHFYIWTALLVFFVISNIFLQIVHGSSLLTVSTIAEALFTIIFAGAINFIDREYLRGKLQNKFAFYLYDINVLLFAFRNLTLFLYDTGLIALSVSLISEEQSKNTSKDVTSFVLVMTVALRGSMAQFYFAKFFQGRHLRPVCAVDYNSLRNENDAADSIGNIEHQQQQPISSETFTPRARGATDSYNDIEYALLCELG